MHFPFSHGNPEKPRRRRAPFYPQAAVMFQRDKFKAAITR
jgi:hypothetical protein